MWGLRLTITLLVLPHVLTQTVQAHLGPPFPLLVDVAKGGFLVSVWADPDIGEATFYFVLESPQKTQPPEPLGATMWVQPVGGRLEKRIYEGKRQHLRGRVQYEFRPDFDIEDQWNIGFQVMRSGAGPIEVVAQVASTPPGAGPWDLLLYAFPFGLLAVFWAIGMRRVRRRRARAGVQSAS